MGTVIDILRFMRLPRQARRAIVRDRKGLPPNDPGLSRAVAEAAAWLCRAQDNSVSRDGGVARHYSLITGWASSYPETTGYIVPTMIRLADHLQDPGYRDRARRMLDWLAEIQMEGGGFQGGLIDSTPRVPVTFNTGQILIGLAAGVATFGAYHDAMHGAARFLKDSLDPDGCWRRHPTPFAKPGEKAYETHVSWGLLEADRVAPGEGYGEAGLRQVDWALTKQKPNGWVDSCCLSRQEAPLTHTLGYFLKGVVEAHRFSGEEKYLRAARLTAEGLLDARRPDGSLPGRLGADWSAMVPWTCLTGNVQIADSWIYLYQVTGDERFWQAACAINVVVRRTLILDGDDGVRGGIAGSFPVQGNYGRFEYLNWATMFMINAHLAEAATLRAVHDEDTFSRSSATK